MKIICSRCHGPLWPLEDRPAFRCGDCGGEATAMGGGWVEVPDDWQDAAIAVALTICGALLVVLTVLVKR